MFEQRGVVAVAGSRRLPAGGAARVAEVARSLVAAGHMLVVGCCRGADAAAMSAVPVSALRVRCAFGPGEEGAGPWSAVAELQAFARAGGAVQWWAGGGAGVPLAARLARRTAAVVGEAEAGLVVFFAAPSSRGSLLAAQCAAARGLPVVAFPLSFAGAQLPSLGAGAWWRVPGAGVHAGALRWMPDQHALL